jgi:hypothetical protein
MGLDPEAQVLTKKVNRGETGRSATELSPEMSQLLDERWRAEMAGAGAGGVTSYAALRAELSILHRGR